jgi:hypothetical protein
MESLERDAGPVLGPLLLGAAPGTSCVLDPDQQAILATWAVKTSLLLALSKFRAQDYGWTPGVRQSYRCPRRSRSAAHSVRRHVLTRTPTWMMRLRRSRLASALRGRLVEVP